MKRRPTIHRLRGGAEQRERGDLGGAPREERFRERWGETLAQGFEELVEARLDAINDREARAEPLVLEAFFEAGLDPEAFEYDRVQIVAQLMAFTPTIWGAALGAELDRLVPLSGLSPRAQAAARWLEGARLSVWEVLVAPNGEVSVASLADPREEHRRVIGPATPTSPDERGSPEPGVGIGWVVTADDALVYLEHTRLELQVVDELQSDLALSEVYDEGALTRDQADREAVRRAVAHHIRWDPLGRRAREHRDATAAAFDAHVRHPYWRNAHVVAAVMALTEPGPVCELILRADSEEALHEAAREARLHRPSWCCRADGLHHPELEPIFDRHIPTAELLKAIGVDGATLRAEELELGSLPASALSAGWGDPGDPAWARRSAREALAAATGHEKKALEASWRSLRAERRAVHVIRVARAWRRYVDQDAHHYRLVRWVLLEIAPATLADTPLSAIGLTTSRLGRLVRGLRRERRAWITPTLADIPERWADVCELDGVGRTTQRSFLTVLTSYLRDWRRAGPPADRERAGQIPGRSAEDAPRDPKAEADLAAGLADLEDLFS